jgi:hypothetical protein
MTMRNDGIRGIVVACSLLMVLGGCTHEVVNVPDHSMMVGSMSLNQAAELRQQTGVHVLDTPNQRPGIDLWYWANALPPADAFERIPFPIDAPDADTTGYEATELAAGSPISISSVEIYANCHVYIARVTGGDLQNVHLLLVVPNGNSRLPSGGELLEQDKAYLEPIVTSTSRSSTAPG